MDGFLLPTIEMTLTNVSIRSMSELYGLKQLLLSTPTFQPLAYAFNKRNDLKPLFEECENGRYLNSCRWFFQKGQPKVMVTHVEALAISNNLSMVLADMGVQTSMRTLTSKLISDETEQVCLATLHRPLLFRAKEHHMLKKASLTEKIQQTNRKLTHVLRTELLAHGAKQDDVVAFTPQLTGKMSDIKALFEQDNVLCHKSGLNNPKRNNQAYRFGFHRLDIHINYAIQSDSLRLGHFKNMGFGQMRFTHAVV